MDTKAICKLFEDHKRVMVRAEYAGSGKTYACKYMKQLGHKVLFVCPTNVLVQNNRDSGLHSEWLLFSWYYRGYNEENDKVWRWCLWCHCIRWDIFCQYYNVSKNKKGILKIIQIKLVLLQRY